MFACDERAAALSWYLPGSQRRQPAPQPGLEPEPEPEPEQLIVEDRQRAGGRQLEQHDDGKQAAGFFRATRGERSAAGATSGGAASRGRRAQAGGGARCERAHQHR